MLEYCAVYPYIPVGKTNQLIVEQNYLSHVRWNPDSIIVPISICRRAWLPGTIFVDELLPSSIHGRKIDFIPLFDHLFFAYLRSDYRVEANKYILLDWDTYSDGVSLRQFLDPVWDSDLGGASLHHCTQERFFWCGDWASCIPDIYYFRSFAVSVFSGDCARTLAEFDADKLCSGFSLSHGSVRNPTCAKRLGFNVKGCSELDAFLSNCTNYNNSGTPSVFHSVRYIVE